RPGQPQVEHGKQALPAGDDLGFIAETGKLVYGLVVAAHGNVLEWRGNHRSPSELQDGTSGHDRIEPGKGCREHCLVTGDHGQAQTVGDGAPRCHRAEIGARREDHVDGPAGGEVAQRAGGEVHDVVVGDPRDLKVLSYTEAGDPYHLDPAGLDALLNLLVQLISVWCDHAD